MRDLKVKTNKLLEAQENAGNQVASGSSFASDWLRGCFLGQSQSVGKKTQFNPWLLSTLNPFALNLQGMRRFTLSAYERVKMLS